ncbi:MAG: DEAD/DEAH box helicase [Clostridia bacterium]|nr:DEAD/DEAH box helicase [Clostridia bacterium]
MEENVTFKDLGLSEEMLRALEDKGYAYPTTVQKLAIPQFMEWKDVVVKATTGTGKTFAFGIPMIEHIDAELPEIQGIVLAPTRELAMQIGEELRSLLSFYKGLRVAVLYGGAGMQGQIRQLEKKPQIIVATPGRLMDHHKRRNLRFDHIQTVVLDEADRMLDMGFYKDVTRIVDMMKNRRNLGLFSATISREVMDVSWKYQRDEVEITVEPKKQDRPDIDQYSVTVPAFKKTESTVTMIKEGPFERVIIFCNTKSMCQRLSDDLVKAGINCDCLHGDIPQGKREKTMQKYRDSLLRVLVATDVASRGIDVDDVDCVINYDIPEEMEYYIHRIGRTGRAQKKGVVFSMINNFAEKTKLEEIIKFTKYEVTPLAMGEDGVLTEAKEK